MTDHAHWEDVVAAETPAVVSPRYNPEHPDYLILDVDTGRRGGIVPTPDGFEVYVPLDELYRLQHELRIITSIGNTNRMRRWLATEETS